MKSLETKTKNINNQTLFKEIDEAMMEMFSTLGGVEWKDRNHREAIADMTDELLEELSIETGKIIQHDVLCDARNNTDDSLRKGVINFTVRYKQKNCFNITEITYTITC